MPPRPQADVRIRKIIPDCLALEAIIPHTVSVAQPNQEKTMKTVKVTITDEDGVVQDRFLVEVPNATTAAKASTEIFEYLSMKFELPDS